MHIYIYHKNNPQVTYQNPSTVEISSVSLPQFELPSATLFSMFLLGLSSILKHSTNFLIYSPKDIFLLTKTWSSLSQQYFHLSLNCHSYKKRNTACQQYTHHINARSGHFPNTTKLIIFPTNTPLSKTDQYSITILICYFKRKVYYDVRSYLILGGMNL